MKETNELMRLIELMLRLMVSVPHDKVLHYLCGLLIYAIGARLLDWWWAGGIVLLVSIIKEWYDSRHGGTVDGYDIVAAMVGAITMFLIYLI